MPIRVSRASPRRPRARLLLGDHKFEIGGQYTAIGLDDFACESASAAASSTTSNKHFAARAKADFPAERNGGRKRLINLGPEGAGLRRRQSGTVRTSMPGCSPSWYRNGGACPSAKHFMINCNSTSFGSCVVSGISQLSLGWPEPRRVFPSRRSNAIRGSSGRHMDQLRRPRSGFMQARTRKTPTTSRTTFQISLGFTLHRSDLFKRTVRTPRFNLQEFSFNLSGHKKGDCAQPSSRP